MKEKNQTAGKTANSNSVASAKAGKTMRIPSLQRQLTKAERDLKNLINRKLEESVVNAQKSIVEQLK